MTFFYAHMEIVVNVFCKVVAWFVLPIVEVG
jgi:hypothetical protein